MVKNHSLKKDQPGTDNIVNEQEQQTTVNSQKDNSYDEKNTFEDFTSEKEMNSQAQRNENDTDAPTNQCTETENVGIDSDNSTTANNSSKVNP
jgi:hypothetical protein